MKGSAQLYHFLSTFLLIETLSMNFWWPSITDPLWLTKTPPGALATRDARSWNWGGPHTNPNHPNQCTGSNLIVYKQRTNTKRSIASRLRIEQQNQFDWNNRTNWIGCINGWVQLIQSNSGDLPCNFADFGVENPDSPGVNIYCIPYRPFLGPAEPHRQRPQSSKIIITITIK